MKGEELPEGLDPSDRGVVYA